MARLGFTGDQIADRINLVLPAKFSRDHASNIWKMLRSLAEVFKINTDGIDELFQQTNISTASGSFLDDYINDLSNIARKVDETDEDYRLRYFRNVFVYSGTKDGMKNIVFDILGYNPLALVSKERGARFDAHYYFNDTAGMSTYGDPNGTAFVGYIYLTSRPSAALLDELCTVINQHKVQGVRIYLKFKNYANFTGTYRQIAMQVMDYPEARVTNPTHARGGFYDGSSYYNDTFYPTVYGVEDESGLTYHYVYLPTKPDAGQLDEMASLINDNLVPGDHVYIRYPAE